MGESDETVLLRSLPDMHDQIRERSGIYEVLIIEDRGVFRDIFSLAGKRCPLHQVAIMLADDIGRCMLVNVFETAIHLNEPQLRDFLAMVAREVVEEVEDIALIVEPCLARFRAVLEQYRKDRGIRPQRVA